MLSLKSLSQNIAFTLKLPSDTYMIFKVVVSYFPAKRSSKMSNVSVQFVEINCVEHDLTLQTVKNELEITVSSFCKIVTNTCVNHVYSVNTSGTTWKHSHVYRVDSRQTGAVHVDTCSLPLVENRHVAEPAR